MSFADAPPRKTALQSATFRNLILPILLLGGLAFVIWSLGRSLWTRVEDDAKTVQAVVKTTSDAAFISETRKHPEEDEEPGAVSIMPEEASPAKIVREWKMRGVIYDLVTLKPVPGVDMILTDNETNARVQIRTDSLGRYRAILPSLAGRGYLVTLSKPDYEKSYLDSGVKAVGRMSLARRKKLARELSSLIAEPAALEPRSEAPLVTDFHLAPSRLP